MLVNTGDFMEGHFKETCDLFLQVRDHKDKVFRKLKQPKMFEKKKANVAASFNRSFEKL